MVNERYSGKTARTRRSPGLVALALGILFSILLGGLVPAWAAQETPAPAPAPTPPPSKQPRAKSQEEFQAYQKFVREQNPDEQIRLLEDFLLQYPDSELKEFAFQAATQAYQTKNDYPRVLTYGELTLAENENNLVALLVLASSISERTGKSDADRDEKLADAEGYAKRALEVLAKLPQPPSLAPEQWERTKKEASATSRAALGMIGLIREDFPRAESELKLAVELASQADPVTLYRLGLCYSFQKKYDLALETLGRAAESGGVKISAPEGETRDLVAEAKEFVLKAKAASETPVSGGAGAPSPSPGSSAP